MDPKFFTIATVSFVIVAVLITRSDCTPVAKLGLTGSQANLVPSHAPEGYDSANRVHRKGRQYFGYGYPHYGGGGATAAAAASASASSGGTGYGGYPYGGFYG